MKISLEPPTIPHKGPSDTDSRMYRTAAQKLRNGYPAGGSTVRAAVAALLEAVAAAMDEQEPGGAGPVRCLSHCTMPGGTFYCSQEAGHSGVHRTANGKQLWHDDKAGE